MCEQNTPGGTMGGRGGGAGNIPLVNKAEQNET